MGPFVGMKVTEIYWRHASNQAAISEPELKDLRIMVPNFSTLKDLGSHDPESKYPP